MIYDDEIESRLHARLRQPESASTVPGMLPILFFGDVLMSRIATVSLNPSRREYTNGKGEELQGWERRFETLRSLGAIDRTSLSAEQCNRTISTMRGYLDPGRPVYNWFNPLSRVLDGMGHSYWRREAAHLDLVQEATDPTWSRLLGEHSEEAQALLERDIEFLRWELETFPIQVLVCNGKSTFDRVGDLINAEVVASEKLARLTWSIAIGSVGDRNVAIVEWNIPLARPTGLTSEGQVEMGRLLRCRLDAVDFS